MSGKRRGSKDCAQGALGSSRGSDKVDSRQASSAGDLRRRAEQKAQALGAYDAQIDSPEELRGLLHELQVHQIELEMQNEELRRTQAALELSRARYFDLYDLAPVGYVTVSDQGIILEANLRAAILLGMSRGALLEERLSAFILPEDQDVYYRFCKQALTASEPQSCELRLRRREGTPFWAWLEIAVAREPQSEGSLWRVILSDISARKQAEELLYAEKERAQITLASIADGVITTDAGGRVESMNPVAEGLLGFREAEARGRPFAAIFRAVEETSRDPIENPVQMALRTGEVTGSRDPVVVLRRDGQEIHIAESAAPMRDRHGHIVGTVTVLRDVSAQHRLTRAMSYQATHDVLTGLVNRMELERRLGLMIEHARQDQREHALCYLDLDQFKIVNDTCGHRAGDELLRQLSALLKSRLRERDTLARIGGDEFGMLLGECPLEQALAIAHTLRELVQGFRFVWEEKAFRVGVSIGLVPINAQSGDLASVLGAADSACYAAKEQGRNRVQIYRPGDEELERWQIEMRWVSRLEEARATERLRLYYQPIVPLLPTGDEEAYGEVLLRFIDESGQIVLPGVFIPAAERYHQMAAIDRYVIQALLTALRRTTLGARVDHYAVNLSGQSLSSSDFLDFVTEQIEASGVAPQRIGFEITETAAIANLEAARHFIAILRAKGCRFALDDFGSGLSSFGYLKSLPVDYLKIDGRFVQDMVKDRIDRAMVEAIQRVGSVMGIQTIAESVENEAILDLLKASGVNYAQGYALGPPIALAEVIEQ